MDNKIAALRSKMSAAGVDCLLIPSQDPHQSEYVADHWKIREWISGFTGSAGIVIVTADHAGLWTDSRYFIQAERELEGSGIVLHKYKVPGQAEHLDWIGENLADGATLGMDGRCFSVHQVKRMQKRFKAKGLQFVYDFDAAEGIWENRPPMPARPVKNFPLELSGEDFASKLERLREKMAKAGGDYLALTTLDDIAWLFNLRGSDVDFNPVFYAWALISMEGAQVFLCNPQLELERAKRFAQNKVEVFAYESFAERLAEIPEGSTVLYHGDALNQLLFTALPKSVSPKENGNPVASMKTLKNEVEVAGIRSAMRKDGVALVKLYRWLEHNLDKNPTEFEVGEKLAGFRAEQDLYFGESFPPIAGYGPNGAIVHYRAEEATAAHLKAEGVFLLDSGGQYWDGTTDITRTVALGKVSEEAQEAYTRVLKGHIALARVIFPKGTYGAQLDLLARSALWEQGWNYGHGTGHGVGHFLNVHEGPQRISPSSNKGAVLPYEPGMFTSNEPGFYQAGAYGIRIENLILCVPHTENEFGTFYKFETLSLFPIDTQMIRRELLSEAEISWLNAYHAKVEKELSPLLNEDERQWLAKKCKADW